MKTHIYEKSQRSKKFYLKKKKTKNKSIKLVYIDNN